MKKTDVVVTGIGAVAANGLNVSEFYSNCIEGITGIAKSRIMDDFNYMTNMSAKLSWMRSLDGNPNSRRWAQWLVMRCWQMQR